MKIRDIKIEPLNESNQREQEHKILECAKQKDLNMLNMLLQNGVNPNSADEFNSTALHFSAEVDWEEGMQLLIKNGANIENIDFMYETPIDWAIRKGKINAIKFLLKNKANIDHKNIWHANSINIALMSANFYNDNILALLIKYKKKYNHEYILLDKRNELYNYEIRKIYPEWISTNEEQKLYDTKAEIYKKYYDDAKEITITERIDLSLEKKNYYESNEKLLKLKIQWLKNNIFLAVQNSDKDKLKKMLNEGANVNWLDAKGRIPLHFAVKLDDPEIMQYLIDEGSYIDFKDNVGNTPLHVATKSQKIEPIKVLLQNGANIDLENTAYFSPMNIAVMKDPNFEILNLFVKQKKKKDSNYILLDKKNELYEFSTNENYPSWVINHFSRYSYFTRARLYLAYYENAKEITTTWSIRHASEWIENRFNYFTKTLIPYKKEWMKENLFVAVKENKKKKVEELLSEGADINIKNIYGDSLLHLAIELDDTEILQYLINENININIKNNKGDTPLHIAIRNEKVEIVKILIQNNADIDLENKEGFTSFHESIRSNTNQKITEMIINKKKKLDSKYILLDEKNEIANFKFHTKYPEWVKKTKMENLYKKRADIYINNYPNEYQITITKKVDNNKEYNDLTAKLEKIKRKWIENNNFQLITKNLDENSSTTKNELSSTINNIASTTISYKLENKNNKNKEISKIQENNFYSIWENFSKEEKIITILFTLAVIPISMSTLSKYKLAGWSSLINKELEEQGMFQLQNVEEVNMEEIVDNCNNFLENIETINDDISRLVDENNINPNDPVNNINISHLQNSFITKIFPSLTASIGTKLSFYLKTLVVIMGTSGILFFAYSLIKKQKIEDKKLFKFLFSNEINVEKDLEQILLTIKEFKEGKLEVKSKELKEIKELLISNYKKYTIQLKKNNNSQTNKAHIFPDDKSKDNTKITKSEKNKEDKLYEENKFFISENQLNEQNKNILKINYNLFSIIIFKLSHPYNEHKNKEIKEFVNTYFLIQHNIIEFIDNKKEINEIKHIIFNEKFSKKILQNSKIPENFNLKKENEFQKKNLQILQEKGSSLKKEKIKLFDSLNSIISKIKEKPGFDKDIILNLEVLKESLEFYEINNLLYEENDFLSSIIKNQKNLQDFFHKSDNLKDSNNEEKEFQNQIEEIKKEKNDVTLRNLENQKKLKIFLEDYLPKKEVILKEINFSFNNKKIWEHIERRVKYYFENNKDYKKLFDFIEHSNLSVIKILIKNGLDVNFLGPEQKISLHLAAKLDDPKILQYLIAKGANINAQDNQGNTPLHVAVQNGKLEAVKVLIDEGADTNLENDSHFIPLDFAVMSDENGEILPFLIKQKKLKYPEYLLLDEKNELFEFKKNGIYPEWVNEKNIKNQYIDRAKFYLKFYPMANEITTDWEIQHTEKEKVLRGLYNFVNSTLKYYKKKWLEEKLFINVKQNNKEAIKKILDKGLNVNCLDTENRLPLHFAAKLDDPEILQYLINEGANINKQDKNGNTSLHVAVNNDNLEAVKILVEKSADLNLENIYYFTPIDVAVMKEKNSEILSLLVKQKKIIDPEYILLDKKNELYEYENNRLYPNWIISKESKKLYDRKVEIYKKYYKDAKEINTIWSINQHSDKNAYHVVNNELLKIKKKWLKENLLHAVKENDKKRVKEYIGDGGDVNLLWENNKSLLHFAVKLDDPEILQYLIDEGANINAQNNNGNTPLHIAVKNEKIENIKILLYECADIHLENSNYFTPIDVAVFSVINVEIFKLLFVKSINENCTYLLKEAEASKGKPGKSNPSKNNKSMKPNFNTISGAKKQESKNLDKNRMRSSKPSENKANQDSSNFKLNKGIDEQKGKVGGTNKLKAIKSDILNKKDNKEKEFDSNKKQNFLSEQEKISKQNKVFLMILYKLFFEIISEANKKGDFNFNNKIKEFLDTYFFVYNIISKILNTTKKLNNFSIDLEYLNIGKNKNIKLISLQDKEEDDLNVKLVNLLHDKKYWLDSLTDMANKISQDSFSDNIMKDKLKVLLKNLNFFYKNNNLYLEKNFLNTVFVQQKDFINSISEFDSIQYSSEEKEEFDNEKNEKEQKSVAKNLEFSNFQEEINLFLKINLDYEHFRTEEINFSLNQEEISNQIKFILIKSLEIENFDIAIEKQNKQNKDFFIIYYMVISEMISDRNKLDDSNYDIWEIKNLMTKYLLWFNKSIEIKNYQSELYNIKIELYKKNFNKDGISRIDFENKEKEKKELENKIFILEDEWHSLSNFLSTNMKIIKIENSFLSNKSKYLDILSKNLKYFVLNNFFYQKIQYLKLSIKQKEEILISISNSNNKLYTIKEKETLNKEIQEIKKQLFIDALGYSKLQTILINFLNNNLLNKSINLKNIDFSFNEKKVLEQINDKLNTFFVSKNEKIIFFKTNNFFEEEDEVVNQNKIFLITSYILFLEIASEMKKNNENFLFNDLKKIIYNYFLIFNNATKILIDKENFINLFINSKKNINKNEKNIIIRNIYDLELEKNELFKELRSNKIITNNNFVSSKYIKFKLEELIKNINFYEQKNIIYIEKSYFYLLKEEQLDALQNSNFEKDDINSKNGEKNNLEKKIRKNILKFRKIELKYHNLEDEHNKFLKNNFLVEDFFLKEAFIYFNDETILEQINKKFTNFFKNEEILLTADNSKKIIYNNFEEIKDTALCKNIVEKNFLNKQAEDLLDEEKKIIKEIYDLFISTNKNISDYSNDSIKMIYSKINSINVNIKNKEFEIECLEDIKDNIDQENYLKVSNVYKDAIFIIFHSKERLLDQEYLNNYIILNNFIENRIIELKNESLSSDIKTYIGECVKINDKKKYQQFNHSHEFLTQNNLLSGPRLEALRQAVSNPQIDPNETNDSSSSFNSKKNPITSVTARWEIDSSLLLGTWFIGMIKRLIKGNWVDVTNSVKLQKNEWVLVDESEMSLLEKANLKQTLHGVEITEPIKKILEEKWKNEKKELKRRLNENSINEIEQENEQNKQAVKKMSENLVNKDGDSFIYSVILAYLIDYKNDEKNFIKKAKIIFSEKEKTPNFYNELFNNFDNYIKFDKENKWDELNLLLRKKIATYLSENLMVYKNTIIKEIDKKNKEINLSNKEKINKYLKDLEKKETFCGENEIAALANILDCPIFFQTGDNIKDAFTYFPEFKKRNKSEEDIFLKFDEDHYTYFSKGSVIFNSKHETIITIEPDENDYLISRNNEKKLDLKENFVKSDGNCFIYSVILGYLINCKNDKEKFIEKAKILFPEKEKTPNFYNELFNYFENYIKFDKENKWDELNLLLRKRIANYILENKEHYADEIIVEIDEEDKGNNLLNNEKINNYLSTLIKNGEGCGEIELEAVCNILQCNIIMQHGNTMNNKIIFRPKLYKIDNEEKVIFLKFNEDYCTYFSKEPAILTSKQETIITNDPEQNLLELSHKNNKKYTSQIKTENKQNDEKKLDLKENFVKSDGNCFIYSVILGYLINCKNDKEKFIEKAKILFPEKEKIPNFYNELFNNFDNYIKFDKENKWDELNLLLRKRIADYIQENLNVYSYAIIAEMDSNDKSNLSDDKKNDIYLNNLRKNKQWCGEIEINTLCNILQCNIILQNRTAENKEIIYKPNLFQNVNEENVIFLKYHNNHYTYFSKEPAILTSKQETEMANDPEQNLLELSR